MPVIIQLYNGILGGRSIDFKSSSPYIFLPNNRQYEYENEESNFYPIGMFTRSSFGETTDFDYNYTVKGQLKVVSVGSATKVGDHYEGDWTETWKFTESKFTYFSDFDYLSEIGESIRFGKLLTYAQIDGRSYASFFTNGVRISATEDADTLRFTDFGETVFAGRGDDDILGRGGNDRLFGEGGKDKLHGAAGNDILAGGLNNDVLIGGTGRDTIIFDTKLGLAVDHVLGFIVADDSIQLQDLIFRKVDGIKANGTGRLVTDQFIVGGAAADLEDRIIYNSVNGRLSYDADGAKFNGVDAILFATLPKNLDMTAADFFVI